MKKTSEKGGVVYIFSDLFDVQLMEKTTCWILISVSAFNLL